MTDFILGFLLGAGGTFFMMGVWYESLRGDFDDR